MTSDRGRQRVYSPVGCQPWRHSVDYSAPCAETVSRRASRSELGVHRTALAKWEAGDRLPRARHLARMLDLYGADREARLEAWRMRAEEE